MFRPARPPNSRDRARQSIRTKGNRDPSDPEENSVHESCKSLVVQDLLRCRSSVIGRRDVLSRLTNRRFLRSAPRHRGATKQIEPLNRGRASTISHHRASDGAGDCDVRSPHGETRREQEVGDGDEGLLVRLEDAIVEEGGGGRPLRRRHAPGARAPRRPPRARPEYQRFLGPLPAAILLLAVPSLWKFVAYSRGILLRWVLRPGCYSATSGRGWPAAN